MFVASDNSVGIVSRQHIKAPAKGWFSPAEAAAVLFVDRSTISRWCQNDPKFAIKVGSRYRITLDSLLTKIREYSTHERENS